VNNRTKFCRSTFTNTKICHKCKVKKACQECNIKLAYQRRHIVYSRTLTSKPCIVHDVHIRAICSFVVAVTG